MNEDDFYSAGMNEFQKIIQEYQEKFEQSRIEAAMMEGAEQLEMTIEGEAEAVLRILRAVPSVAEAICVHEDGKKSVYRITAEPDADVRGGLRASGANDSGIESWIADNGISE